ncbi:MAG TPA: glycosyltransferase [Nocardioides bacterium]|nr:glycosyltransferase [Nocardioides sp.]
MGPDEETAMIKNTWVVVPALNEADNLVVVVPRILSELVMLGGEGHVLVVDDGSTDKTREVMDDLADRHEAVEVISLGRNLGKASALRRGFERALAEDADVVVMMDADGQDDPAELPLLLARLEDGADLVTGARTVRHDRFIKRHTSKLYNATTARLSGTPGRDFNSGFKVMRADVARHVSPMLYGELHRYLTVVAHWLGFRVAEVSVQHHERLHGRTKYGLARFWRGFVDLVTVRFLMSYESRPSHLFSGIGLVSLALGGLALAYLLVERVSGAAVGGRPLLIAGVVLALGGLQLVLFGLLAELHVYSRQRERA